MKVPYLFLFWIKLVKSFSKNEMEYSNSTLTSTEKSGTLDNYTSRLDVASFFTLIELKSLSPSFGCSFVQWTWWELQNWTFEVKVCSIWRFKFEFSVVDILLTSLASGADDQPSRAIASKQSFNVKKRYSKLNRHMLLTLP